MKLGLILVFTLYALAGNAAEITATGQAWQVQPDFEKGDEARLNLSGAICVTGTSHCLIANDEKKYAQFFEIGANVLKPGAIMRLLADEVGGVDMKEIDAEAVAFADGFFFVTGSHGLSRHGGEFRPSTFHLFRFKVDTSTGLPSFPFADDKPAAEIASTSWLRDIILEQPELKPFAEQRLDQNGANIEGMAAQGSDLLFGFRAPSVGTNKDKALVLRVPAAPLFGKDRPKGKVHTLTLEPGLGVRDMTAIQDNVLLLAGPSQDTEGKASLWRWDGLSDKPIKLGDFPDIGPSEKAETLLVIGNGDTGLRVLLLFDGIRNGGPREFLVAE